MPLFKQDPFGHTLFVKKWLIRVFGLITHSRYDGFNQLKIEGSDIIRELPPQNVMFISNHQTYFADVTAMYHVFNASLKGRKDTLDNIGYLWNPKLNIYYVAASETMKSGILPKILGYAGAIPVNRTWREKGKEVHREVRRVDVENIGIALGTAHLIKQYKPIMVPIVIDGYRRSFDKKGINIKKKGVQQSMIIKPPLQIDYENDTVEEIVTQIEMAIEQHESFLKVKKLESENTPKVEGQEQP